MIHYLLVRRDLPFGVTLAQLAHAAADSMSKWINDSSYASCSLTRNCWVTGPKTSGMTVVVLGVKNERILKNWERKFQKRYNRILTFTSVREPDAPWNGQLMAIGVHPGPRDILGPIFKNLQTFRFEDWTGQEFKRLEDVR